MTTPSIIYDQEKIELLKSKADLAGQLLDQKLLPTDWIYDNVFHFSEDQYDEYRDLIKEDTKRQFRLAQIEAEGNDPVETGKSYGTPHDLASLYGKGRSYSDPGNVPVGYDETDKTPLGRPKDNVRRNKQDDNFGKDRLGAENKPNESDSIRPQFKGGSPLALENAGTTYRKNLDLFENLDKKKISVENKSKNPSYLDESQLKE
jgi:hypothetical protein